MKTIRVSEILKDKVLVSREAARRLEDALRAQLDESQAATNGVSACELAVDFVGVEGIAPSFLDELITIIESLTAPRAENGRLVLFVANPPTRLTSKFEAIARGHGAILRQERENCWRFDPQDP